MITSLPLEVLANIVSYLSIREFHSLAATNRSMRAIARGGFVFDIADYSDDPHNTTLLSRGILCRLRKPYVLAGKVFFDVNGPTPHLLKSRVYYMSPNAAKIVIAPIASSVDVHLYVSSMDVVVKSYVRRIVLLSVPQALVARVDEIKLFLRHSSYVDVDKWTSWMSCKRLIMVIVDDGVPDPNRSRLQALIQNARLVSAVARGYVSTIKISLIVEDSLSADVVAWIVRALPLVAHFKFRDKYHYTDLAPHRTVSKHVYIRRIFQMYELNVRR